MYIQVKGKGWTGIGTALGWNGMIYLFSLGGGDLRGDLLRARGRANPLKVFPGIHGQGKLFSNNARKDLTNEQIGIY